jgi:hypothetical protein
MILETHKKYYIEHLKVMGATPELAEAIIELHIEGGENLATKADIIHFENATKADIAQLGSKIEKIETKIDTNNKWVMAVLSTILTVLLSEGIGIIIILLSK